jgi:hypothetical protein
MGVIPGFTAEASVYETSGRYRMATTRTPAAAWVQPALIRDPDCVDQCILRCAERGAFAQACFNHCAKRCPVLVFEPLPQF